MKRNTSSARSDPARPNPSAPWVIDTRDLGRGPGALRSFHYDLPAPAGLELDMIRIAEGSEVAVRMRLESVLEGILVSGTAAVAVSGECARCLDPLADRVEVDLTELFAYPDTATDDSTDPDEVSRVVDDLIDLEPAIRDALLLALPLAPLCREDCPGLCPDCGGRRADLGPSHGHEKMDPRWAALAQFSAPGGFRAPEVDRAREDRAPEDRASNKESR